jgi:hypothetical protein
LNGPEPINYANTSIELNITVIDYLSGIDYCWYNVYFTENDTYLLTNQFIPNCSNNTPVTSSFSVPTGDNDISITVYVNDSANNTDNLGVTIGIRTESPAIVLNYPTANKYFNTTSDILFNFTATDLKDGVNAIDYCALWTNTTGTWELNQTTWIASSGVNYNWATVDISEGYFKWNVFCNDAYNNSEWAASNYTFTTDITAPILNITTPLNGSSVSSTTVIFNYTLIETNVYTCEFNVLNSLGVWEYSPNQTLTCSNGSRAISVPVGTHTLYIWSTDRAGNTNYTSSTFTVSSTSGGGGGGGAEPIEIIKEVPSNKTFCGDGICQTEGNDLGIREDFFSCQQDCPGFNIDSAIFYCFDSDPNTICIWDSVKYQYIGLFLGIVLAILLFSTVEDKKTKKQVSLIRYWIIVAKRDKDKGKKKKRKDKNMKPREYRRI